MTVNFEKAVIDHMIDLYETDGEVVALIEVVLHEKHLLIENFAVRPDQQGKRIGELLLNHAETIARSRHLAELRLYTNSAFVSNIEFYSRRGFQEFLREPFSAGGITVHMRKLVELLKPH